MNIVETDFTRGGAHDLRRIEKAAGCVIIGSSASGKSTMIRQLRRSEAMAKTSLRFPRRLITREVRINEDLTENMPVTPREMQGAIEREELEVWWSRNLGHGVERYAFQKEAGEGSFPIYSANNALVRSREPQVCEFLASQVVVQIYARDHVRAERLQARSPELFEKRPEEVAVRLGDSSDSMTSLADYIVRNDGCHESGAPALLERLIYDLVQQFTTRPRRS
jgi:ribose 1,5-bisphosphokinase PhnN